MPILEETSLGYPMPHPDNSPYTVDVPRARTALEMITAHIEALHAARDALAADKADKLQVAIDIAAAVSQAISDLLDGAPAAYDTLVEIASKLTDNDDVVANILSTLALKANAADVAAALGLKADAAAMTDALALKADKATVADQLAGKASHGEVKAEVQTVSPIGNIVHAAAAPDETYLPLDGSKYLRSAYPLIAPMFAGMPGSLTSTPISGPPGINLYSGFVASGDYLFGIDSASGACYRAPATTVAGGADFVVAPGSPPAGSSRRLFKADSGRLVHIGEPSTGVAGAFRYSDDHGDTWSDSFPISARTMTGTSGVIHVGDTMVFVTTQGLLRVEDNVPVAAVVVNTSSRSWVQHGDYVVAVNNGQFSRYHTPSGVLEFIWGYGSFGGNFNMFTLDGELCGVSDSITQLQSSTLAFSRIVHPSYAQLEEMWLLGRFSTYSPRSLTQAAIAAGNNPNGKGLLALGMLQANDASAYRNLLLVADMSGNRVEVDLGIATSSAIETSFDWNVIAVRVGTILRRVTLDTDPEIEFRLPNRPNHFIKAVA